MCLALNSTVEVMLALPAEYAESPCDANIHDMPGESIPSLQKKPRPGGGGVHAQTGALRSFALEFIILLNMKPDLDLMATTHPKAKTGKPQGLGKSYFALKPFLSGNYVSITTTPCMLMSTLQTLPARRHRHFHTSPSSGIDGRLLVNDLQGQGQLLMDPSIQRKIRKDSSPALRICLKKASSFSSQFTDATPVAPDLGSRATAG